MIVIQFIGIFLAALSVENLLFTRAMDVPHMREMCASPKRIIEYGCLVTLILIVAAPFSYGAAKLLRGLPVYGYILALVMLLILTGLYAGAYFLLKKYAPLWFQRIGRQLPYAAFNCATLGTMLLASKDAEINRLWKCLAYHMGAGVGFMAAMLLLWSVHRRQKSSQAPNSFRGEPLQLVTIGLIALALAGLVGNQLPA